ncbi:hypothetical protein XENOCAPTIV_001551 [Xenoophorus captivus]|uniref:Uncharacterized protein n=1 Tax=Xenoophorus captivus TaxID=1517983 RepID=A0ABV0RKI1_9TELE
MPQPRSGRRGDAPAEECRSPRRKRPRLERPSRQEVDFLRAEVEQLKALLKAPEPTPAFQAAAAWESGEDLEDDGISVRASNSDFQSLEDQRDPFPDPRDRDGDPPSIGGNDGSGNSLGSSVSSGPGEEPCPLRAIILAALAKVYLDDAPGTRHRVSTLVVTRRQVWLAQAPISDDCRQSLRRLPVIPGQLFGPEAERALERRRQSSQAPEAWGGRSGAMGPPAPQPRRRDMREPRRQFRTTTPAQFAQRSRAVAGAWRQPGVEQAPPGGALAGPDRSRRPPRGRSRRQRAA